MALNSFWEKIQHLSNLNVKADNFYPLNSTAISGLIGFDSTENTIQSQQQLIDTGYGQNVTAYSIIKKIAQTGASLPIYIYTTDKTGKKVKVEKGDLFETMKRPATMQGESLSQYDWMEMALTYLLTTGNLYQYGVKATGFGDLWYQLQFLPSGFTCPIVPNSYLSQPLGYSFYDMNKTVNFKFEEVLHTRFISPTTYGLNNFIGLSPLQASIYALTGSTDIQKAIAVMVKNQGVRGVLTNESDRSMTNDERIQAQSIADAKLRGLDKFNKVMVANTKMNYLQIGMSSTDLKIIESGILTDRQLSNAYSFPSVLLNDPANTSYNNYSEAVKALYSIATIPVVTKILDDLNNIWIAQWSKRDKQNYSLEVAVDEIEALQKDQKVIAEKDKINSDAIIAVLASPISQDSKKNILVFTHGLDEETAKAIVGTAMPILTPVSK
jgi:HK97 family phage portal protein